MTVNQLPSIPIFWDYNHFVGNVSIQNIFARPRHQVVLHKTHFEDNTKQDKTEKSHKIFFFFFETILSNEPEQRIDEYVTKFK